MTISPHLIFLLLALVCFLLATAGVAYNRFSILAFGLFWWCLSTIVR